jgi:4-hydroxy-3-methylbut-2-enyl diphosphate reductase IspH
MVRKKSKLPKHKQVWNKIRKKAPKVPDITCPAIDDVINRLEKLSNTSQKLTTAQYKVLANKMEKLRTANEQLRDSGIYWHNACEEVINDYIAKKKKPTIW